MITLIIIYLIVLFLLLVFCGSQGLDWENEGALVVLFSFVWPFILMFGLLFSILYIPFYIGKCIRKLYG